LDMCYFRAHIRSCHSLAERIQNETKNAQKMKKFYLIYFTIIASIVLMIYNISELDFDNLEKGPFAGIVSNVLLILAMLFTIRGVKKKENN
jgi:hypothetical protein